MLLNPLTPTVSYLIHVFFLDFYIIIVIPPTLLEKPKEKIAQ